jgi:hypothetical protein
MRWLGDVDAHEPAVQLGTTAKGTEAMEDGCEDEPEQTRVNEELVGRGM